MEIPNEIKNKIKKDVYSDIEENRRLSELHLIIGKQQRVIEDVMNFCIKSTSDSTIDISHIRRILDIMNNNERSPIGANRVTPTKMKIRRK